MANLINVCRACLKQADKHHPLFENYANDVTLASILNRFTQNKISLNNNLSNILCGSCTRILIEFNNFILLYERSTKTLTSIQNELENKLDAETKSTQSTNESITQTTFTNDIIELPTEGSIFVCDVCGKICKKRSDLKDHLETHDAELKYSCEVCKKRLKCRTSLVGHMRAHYKPKQYMCELCGRKFTQMSTLRTHRIQLHTAEKKYQCVICDRRFSLNSVLKKHVERHRNREGGVEKLFNCLQCDMKYFDKSSLSRHVYVKHAKGNSFRCELCDISFSTSRNLLRHRNVIHVNG